MAQGLGNPTGPLYLFGKIAPAAGGTPVALNQNVVYTTSLGTPSTGVPGLTTAGNPAIIQAQQFIFMAPVANTGKVYVCYKGGSRALPNSIIAEVSPGGYFILAAPQNNNPFQADQFLIDAAVNGEGVYVTAVIV